MSYRNRSYKKARTYEDVIEQDIELSWAVQHYVHSNPKLEEWMLRIVDKSPLRDICSLIWIFFIIGCVEMRMKHFWVVIPNLFLCYILRKIIEAKRPVEYDIRLQPMTDRGAESYALPSIESYMSVVIFGHFVYHYKSILLLILGSILTGIIGFSRVYSKARFAHQIVASWILGFIGLNLAIQYCESIKIHQVKRTLHGYWGSIVVAIIIINFALAMENNDSRLLSVSKQDFIKVIRGILTGSSEEDDQKADGQTDMAGSESEYDNDDSQSEIDGSASTHSDNRGRRNGTRSVQSESSRMRNRVTVNQHKKIMGVTKRDSFYFLQKTLIRRSNGTETAAGIGPSPASTPRSVRFGGTPRYFFGQDAT